MNLPGFPPWPNEPAAYLRNDKSVVAGAHALDTPAYSVAQVEAMMRAYGEQVARDYEEVIADNCRLVREMDVILNGEAGAAKQASLCDIVGQVANLFDCAADMYRCLKAIDNEFVDPLEPWGPDLELPRDWLLEVRDVLRSARGWRRRGITNPAAPHQRTAWSPAIVHRDDSAGPGDTPLQNGQTMAELEAIEREHFGDPDKRTGIYAVRKPQQDA